MTGAAGDQREQAVPGVVRVVTTVPLEIPASASAPEGFLAEQLEERPWLLSVAILALLAALLVLRQRRGG